MEKELQDLLNVASIKEVKNTLDKPIAIMNFIAFPEWLVGIAMALAEHAASKVLEEYIGADPVDVSHKTLNEIESLLQLFVGEVVRTEWEGVVNSSIEKFNIYNNTRETSMLDSILERNIEAMYVLKNAGPSAVIAWMAAAQNVLAALLIKYGENNQAMKDAAGRYITQAVDFLREAYIYNENRVSNCNNNCEQGRDRKWKCCHVFDGNEYCTKRQSKVDARRRCNEDADSTRNRIVQEFELAVYNPAYVALREWEKIKNS
ncbi:hypothetical protein FDF11_10105 [Clostridium botulinum]|nr:hypothetical protein [Clostridium botulinum]NFR15242.1 hypothetical protein [Clostridium botulinum]NFR43369.1 hypothetical protein [Clostridium botulinum]NFS51027.1 hypothetical protein [Clostridium botulinum]